MSNLISRRHTLSAIRALRTIVVGAILAGTAVFVDMPGAQAVTVPCSASSLVTAVNSIAGSGGTVTLTAGCTYTLTFTTAPNTLDGPSAFSTITSGVTIVGNGATITRASSGATDFRFFIIDSNGNLTLNNLTLSNGSIPSGEVHGGGAIINRDHLTVNGVTFHGNRSMGDAGGGAIDNHDKGVLVVNNSTFDSNSALQGGAIEDEATLCHISIPVCGNSTVTNSSFTNNSTSSFGGGGFESQLDTTSAPICPLPASSVPTECQEQGGAHDVLTGDTFSGNLAMTEGGAIANFGTTSVTNSTIFNNGIIGTSGVGDGGGGGLQNTGTLTITEATIAGNKSLFGADIHVITDATHQPGATTIGTSIVAAGSTANCSVATTVPATPAITDGGYNIDTGSTCGFSSANHSMNVTDPMLSSLASNGGPTQTMALLAGSPAIGAGPTSCSPGSDQRGAPRGSPCDIGAFEVYTTPPTVPTGLAATANGGHEIDLSWSASTSPIGVAGYDIWRNGTKIATVSGSTLTYANTGLTDATTYHYTVDAFDAVTNTSSQSSQASATTPDVTAPSIPSGLHASAAASGHEIDLSWSASSDNVGVSGYTVYRGGSVLTTVVGTSYADKSVSDATSYSYTVDAFDAAGNHSNQSAPASATTPDVTPPTVPTGLSASATKTPSVVLNWSAAADNVGVSGYDVYRNGSSTPLATVSGSTLTYTDSAVAGNTPYSYRVDAFDAAGNHSAQSAPASVNTPDTTPPSVPSGVSAVALAHIRQVNVSWNASTDDVGVNGYTVYRDGVALTTVSGTTLSYQDTAVADVTTYHYTIDAFDAAGNHSAQSAVASVSTPDWTPPSVPGGVSAVAMTKTPQVNVSWSASSDNVAVSGYDVYRNGVLLASVSGSSLSYADKAVVDLTAYSYTVDAFDAAGNHSAQSVQASLTTPDWTPPTVPGGVSATAATVSSVVVSWNASTDNVGVSGYTVYRNGSALAAVPSSSLTYTDSTVQQGTSYSYSVDAFDAAGNHSAQSAGVPVTTGSQLFFNWYDNASPGVNAETIHITNPNTSGTASGVIFLSGATSIRFSVPAGHDGYYEFPQGTIGGPVVITSSAGRVLASLRAWYYQSFNETPARSANEAATNLYLPWYDLASAGVNADTIHITNPGASAANGSISLSGAASINFTVGAGQDRYFTFPHGTIGGPVSISADQPVLASLRAWYYQSFNETLARPQSAAASSLYFPWYDLASPGMRADTIHITNESGSTATGTISLSGAASIPFSVPNGHDGYFAFPSGTIGGPVSISSNQPVLATLRAWYYQSFNETAARPGSAAATTQYFPWYDLASPGMRADTIHITNESGSTATGTISLPGASPISFSLAGGHDAYFAFPAGTIGGPVVITSDQPVLASLRAWYYNSFNEVPAQS